MKLEQAQHEVEAHAAGGRGLPSRFLVVLCFAAELRAAFRSLRHADATTSRH